MLNTYKNPCISIRNRIRIVKGKGINILLPYTLMNVIPNAPIKKIGLIKDNIRNAISKIKRIMSILNRLWANIII